MDTTIIYIDNYLKQGIVHQLMSLGNLVLPGDLANQSRGRRWVMRLTGWQLPAAVDSRSRRAGDFGTLGLIFSPYLPFFFHLLSAGMQYCTQNPRKKGNIVRNFHIPGERSIQTIGGQSVVERILQDRSCLLS